MTARGAHVASTMLRLPEYKQLDCETGLQKTRDSAGMDWRKITKYTGGLWNCKLPKYSDLDRFCGVLTHGSSMSNASAGVFVLFVGGHDLEMRELLRLVRRHRPRIEIIDSQLKWGACASDYEEQIREVLAEDRCPVLIELMPNLSYPLVTDFRDWIPGKLLLVDHHNQFGGVNAPTSLEQICQLLEISESELSIDERRRLQLVDANDKGHIAAMRQLNPPATQSEIQQIRLEERRIQGVSQADELAARELINTREIVGDEQLTIIHHHLTTSVPISDFLSPELGGPGFQNLLMIGDGHIDFIGARWIVEHLASQYPPPESWSGGALEEIAFWGTNRVHEDEVLKRITEVL